MLAGKVYGVASTVLSAATVGAATSTVSIGAPPTIIPYIGAVPIFAVAVGVCTALLVRVVTSATSTVTVWRYNAAITAIAMLGAATTIMDHQVSVGNSFWVGGAFGAAGVSTVGVMRSKLFVAIFDAIRGGLVKGLSDPAAPPAPPADDVAAKSE